LVKSVSQLKEFYCKRIEPHEDLFVFYRLSHLFHFDTNSNSAHEGTNHGIKYHSLFSKTNAWYSRVHQNSYAAKQHENLRLKTKGCTML
jgi:hypothetical protein